MLLRWYCVFQGNLVAVGTHKGYVQIWDAGAGKKLFALEGHTARVGENSFDCVENILVLTFY